MASAAVLGALRVILGADSSEFDKGLGNAESGFSKFAKNILTIAGGVGLERLFEKTFQAITKGITGGLVAADKFGKAAQKFGVPVAELSAVSHAADLSDVSFETLGKSLGKLSRGMSEIAGGGTNDAAKAFRALGISVTTSDGSLKSSTQVMTEVAGKFAGMEDGAGKTALAMAIFGRSGAELIPMLNSGAAGLRDMMKEAADLGLVIDQKTAKAAEGFNDNLTRLGKVKDGVALIITAKLAPALERFTNGLVEGIKNSAFITTAAEVLTRAIVFLYDNLQVAATALGILLAAKVVSLIAGFGLAFLTFARAVATATLAKTLFNAASLVTIARVTALGGLLLWATGNLQPFMEGLKKVVEIVGELIPADTFTSITDGLKKFGVNVDALTGDLKGLGDASAETGASIDKKLKAPVMAAKTALDSFLDSQRKSIAAQDAETASVGMAAGAKERLRITQQALQIAQQNHILVTDALRLKIDALALSAQNAALKLNAANLVQQSLPAWQLYQQEVSNAQRALDALGATAEQKGAVLGMIAERASATWGQASESMAGSFKDIATSFSKESSAMAVAAKVFGIVQGTISMFTGAAKALELPFPANLAAMAAVLAKGASLVASIKGTSIPAMATGGAITVPGGVGGGDRVRAMVDLMPGEQLDVWRPGQGGGDPRRGAGGAPTIVNLQIVDRFTREFFGSLIDGINGAVSDGYRLKVA